MRRIFMVCNSAFWTLKYEFILRLKLLTEKVEHIDKLITLHEKISMASSNEMKVRSICSCKMWNYLAFGILILLQTGNIYITSCMSLAEGTSQNEPEEWGQTRPEG